jgi:diguanylate cyclase (GGDEF)-like protein
MIISYARRIFDENGEPLSIMCIDVLFDKIAEYVLNIGFTEEGYGMLLSDNMEIIATPSKEYIGRHLSELPHKGIPNIVSYLENGINIYEHEVIDNQKDIKYVLFTKQLENGWHLGILTPVDKYYQNVTIMRNFITGSGIVLAFLLSFILYRIAEAKRKADEKTLSVERLMRKTDDLNKQLICANEKLEELSTTDELTKLNNRRSFLEYMNIIWKQNHRLNLPITVVMIDVDYFKNYKDTLGHLEGDKALVSIAQCMKSHAKREIDFVARFGGEEFIYLLPFIEGDEAVSFAKALISNVENMNIPHPMSECSQYLTISAGIASMVPDDNNSHEKILDEADKALYMAKKTGRNRVVVN